MWLVRGTARCHKRVRSINLLIHSFHQCRTNQTTQFSGSCLADWNTKPSRTGSPRFLGYSAIKWASENFSGERTEHVVIRFRLMLGPAAYRYHQNTCMKGTHTRRTFVWCASLNAEVLLRVSSKKWTNKCWKGKKSQWQPAITENAQMHSLYPLKCWITDP